MRSSKVYQEQPPKGQFHIQSNRDREGERRHSSCTLPNLSSHYSPVHMPVDRPLTVTSLNFENFSRLRQVLLAIFLLCLGLYIYLYTHPLNRLLSILNPPKIPSLAQTNHRITASSNSESMDATWTGQSEISASSSMVV